MIMKMLSRGAVVVAGMMATQAALDKLEKSWLKREKNIKNSKKKGIEVKPEELSDTEKMVVEVMENHGYDVEITKE